MYKTKKASNSGIFADINPQRSVYTSNIIIAPNSTDFNPNATINKEPNSYEETLKCISELDKGGLMDEKLKELCAGVVNAFIKAKNEADAEKEKTDEEKRKEEEKRKKEEEAKNKAKNDDKEGKEEETAKTSMNLTQRRMTPVKGMAAFLPNQPILHTCIV